MKAYPLPPAKETEWCPRRLQVAQHDTHDSDDSVTSLLKGNDIDTRNMRDKDLRCNGLYKANSKNKAQRTNIVSYCHDRRDIMTFNSRINQYMHLMMTAMEDCRTTEHQPDQTQSTHGNVKQMQIIKTHYHFSAADHIKVESENVSFLTSPTFCTDLHRFTEFMKQYCDKIMHEIPQYCSTQASQTSHGAHQNCNTNTSNGQVTSYGPTRHRSQQQIYLQRNERRRHRLVLYIGLDERLRRPRNELSGHDSRHLRETIRRDQSRQTQTVHLRPMARHYCEQETIPRNANTTKKLAKRNNSHHYQQAFRQGDSGHTDRSSTGSKNVIVTVPTAVITFIPHRTTTLSSNDNVRPSGIRHHNLSDTIRQLSTQQRVRTAKAI